MDQTRIRNFCIIAHIDHGKSTLADRLMELTETVDRREMKSQLLDSMDLEREKGITIKLAPVRMQYRDYTLNLIDTPGHVDFSYEVSRSLAACEGAILVVDATQGIQAQTLANVYLAIEADLTIVPVINKIDLPAADVEKTSAEIINLLGCKTDDIIYISAKTGHNVEAVLRAVVDRIPPPSGQVAGTTRALIFDSFYDDYRGVILYVRVVDGQIDFGDQIIMMGSKANGQALEVGVLNPKMLSTRRLTAGEIGYLATNLHSTHDAKVGDTVTINRAKAEVPLPGYRHVKPFVYAGFFPMSNDQYLNLKNAVDKLSLSDSSLSYEPENSPVLGYGVRIGFLGLLHMDIVRQRLEREYGLELVVTNPSTDYEIKLKSSKELTIRSASELPDPSSIAEIREPWIKGEIVAPKAYIGAVLQLINGRRGHQSTISYIDERALISFEAPLANMLTDFYDQLKSVTSGYGSFNYELAGYYPGDLVRIDFYVAGEPIDALAVIAHRSEAQGLSQSVVNKLKEVIPRQNFKVALQAAIGGKFIARADLSAYRKDVTGALYGGDVSRKKKLLAKQTRGKKRLKRFGKVDIPAEAFAVMLRRD